MNAEEDRSGVWGELADHTGDVVGLVTRLKYLAANPRPEELPQFVEWLGHQDRQLAHLAGTGLAHLGSRIGHEIVLRVFELVPPRHLARVAHILAAEDALPLSVVSLGLSGPSGSAKLGCLAAAAAHGRAGRTLIPQVRESLNPQGPDPGEIALAAIALARLQDRDETTRLRILEAISCQDDPGVRHMGALALLELGEPRWEELPVLSRALADAPEDLWEACAAILEDYGIPLEDLRLMDDSG